jgi:hypothetical protein
MQAPLFYTNRKYKFGADKLEVQLRHPKVMDG